MNNKNAHVAMEKRICLVTGREYETGQLLLAKSYNRKTGESVIDLEGHNPKTGFNHNVTGNGFCPEVQEKLDDGFVALVCVNSEKSDLKDSDKMNPEDAYRTGEVIYMKKDVAAKVFDRGVETMAFIDEGATEKLRELEN